MAVPQEDTSQIRAWVASQLKLEDVPEPIWDYLVEGRYVEEAQNPDYPDARGNLVAKARKLVRIAGTGADAPKVPKKQRTNKRQKATAHRRSEVVDGIAAKISKAKANKVPDTPTTGEEKPEALTPEQQLLLANTRKLEQSPLLGSIENNRIIVSAEPYVSPDDVRKAYQETRDMWFWERTPSERRVELVAFVAGFCQGYYNQESGAAGLKRGPDWPGWRGIMEQWNQRYAQERGWRYKDARNLERDFRDAFETITAHKDF